MYIPDRRQSNSTRQLRPQVAYNDAKQVSRDEDVELPRIANHFHSERINVQVARLDIREFLANVFEHPLPKTVGKGHGIGFIAHTNALQLILSGILESIADDPFDALPRIDVFLDGDLLGGIFLEAPAHADVKALRIFANDHHANLFRGAIPEWREPSMQKLHGTRIHIEGYPEPQTQPKNR